MGEKNQQYTSPQNSPDTSGKHGLKNIQPSAEFEKEMNSAQPAQEKPAPTPQAVPADASQSVQPKPLTSSIYPDATQGIGMPAPAPTQSPSSQTTHAEDPKRAKKILAVRVVAAILILFNGLNAYDVLVSLHNGFKGYGLLSIIMVFVMLGLAIGIFMLKEIARAIYIFIAAVSLIIGIIGFVNFYTSTHKARVSNAYSHPFTKTQLENSLHAAQTSPSFTPKVRQEEVAALQRQINNLSKNPIEQKAKQYFSYGLLIFVAIFPLVFLTRPTIKEVFE